ncbi:MAG: VOC family protein [Phycisphaeraceae bacterium]|nr:MAG: VOC family protein [Phycisphaeraceae bacterium]
MERTLGVLETVLYASDLAVTGRFYHDVIGLESVYRDRDLLTAFRTGPESVLLLFDPAESEAAGRSVPTHGGRGPGHIAFLIEEAGYDAWLARLARLGVEIEQEHVWDDGSKSIYVRDPAGNSVELITGDIWHERLAEA